VLTGAAQETVTMPMYYFHLLDRGQITDTDGTDLPDLDSARNHARTVARELTFRNSGVLERDWSDWTMSVHDEQGKKLFSLPMADFRNSNSN
jgi:hypothetical protein